MDPPRFAPRWTAATAILVSSGERGPGILPGNEE
jgi:hypothetical protein